MKDRFMSKTVVSALATLAACGEGQGTATFTTWGEEYIEQEIPSDASGEGGFVDGWSVTYDKFLVAFHAIEVADRNGKVGARSPGSFLVDNTRPGVKELVSFPNLAAQRWEQVGYQIKPADEAAQLVSATQDDLMLMLEHGYALYVAGTATKQEGDATLTKTFRWGFDIATQYHDCLQTAESGQEIDGIVVTDGGDDVSQLTTHGDHFFYDRLAESADPAVKTSLRFEALAAADVDLDGEVTLDELFDAELDLRLYNPSGLPAANLGEFLTALARTVGHFRGEGECAIARL